MMSAGFSIFIKRKLLDSDDVMCIMVPKNADVPAPLSGEREVLHSKALTSKKDRRWSSGIAGIATIPAKKKNVLLHPSVKMDYDNGQQSQNRPSDCACFNEVVLRAQNTKYGCA